MFVKEKLLFCGKNQFFRRNNHRHTDFSERRYFLKKGIDIFLKYAIIQKLSDSEGKYGGIAQLGERLNGIQEVSGSIPLISTRKS